MVFDLYKIRRAKAEIGIALALSSIPLGMIVKLLTGYYFVGNLLMALGLLSAFPFHRLLDRVSITRLFGIVLFQLLSSVYFFIGNYEDKSFLIYLGVNLLFSITLLFYNYDDDFSLENVINYLWIFSLIFVIGGFTCFATGEINVLDAALTRNDDGDVTYDGLTMGSMAITQIVCSCHLLMKETIRLKYQPYLLLIIIIDFILVLLTVKRTPLLIAMIVVSVYFKRLGYFKPSFLKIVISSILIVGATFFVLNNSEVKDALLLLTDDTVSGIENLLTSTHTGHSLTNSTDVRLDNREQAFDIISNFDILNVCIGDGFMTFWCDIPLLQSFMDMGLIGFSLYGYYIVFLPLWILLKRKDKELLYVYAMLAIYGSISCMTSGHPYANARWMPVCLLCYAICSFRKNNECK